MRRVSMEQLKTIELELLGLVDRLCKEHHLRYYLCGGTLLGAVRHKGFIPWDDDIDIVMPRPDYEQLVEILENDENYHILTEKDPGYYYTFGKLVDRRTWLEELNCQRIDGLGVYIDIFPMDGMPTNEQQCLQHFNKLDKQRKKITGFSQLRPRIRKNFAKLLSSYIGFLSRKHRSLENEQKSYKSLALQYPYDEADKVYITGGAYGERDIIPKSWMGNGVSLDFEGKKFSAPDGYSDYLKQLYGDYMTLPPIDKRVSHHNFVAYYK